MQGSASKVNRIRRCKHAYYYSDILNLTRKSRAIAPYKGQLIHSCLEAHYSGKDWTQPIKDLPMDMENVFDEERVEWANLASDVYKILRPYFSGYREADSKFTTLATEFYFEMPLGAHTYRGYIDWIAENDEGVWVIDTKTTKVLPKDQELYMDMQTLIYYDACRTDPKLIALLAGRKLAGVMFNYICTKAPKEPKMLKNNSLSKEAINTDISTYFRAVKANGLDPEDYADMVDKLKDNIFFKRVRIPVSETTLSILKQEIIATLDEAEVLHMYAETSGMARFPRTMLKMRCEWDCPYRRICFAELAGMNTSSIIDAEYEIKVSERGEEDNGE